MYKNKKGFLLTGRRFHVDGTWYAPSEALMQKASVVKTVLMDTTSSAGDWNGYLVQKRHRMYYAIPFIQENSCPGPGFDVTTGERVIGVCEDLRNLQTFVQKRWNANIAAA